MSLLSILKTIVEHVSAFCRKKSSTALDVLKMKRINVIIQHKRQHDEARHVSAAPMKGKDTKKKSGAPPIIQKAETSQDKGHADVIHDEPNSQQHDKQDEWKKKTKLIRGRIQRNKSRSRSRWA